MNENTSRSPTVKHHRQNRCTVEGCDREPYTHGYCKSHYLEWWKSLRDGQWEQAKEKGDQET